MFVQCKDEIPSGQEDENGARDAEPRDVCDQRVDQLEWQLLFIEQLHGPPGLLGVVSAHNRIAVVLQIRRHI